MATTQETRAVLITGTSTGIGRATALYLDRLGFRVYAAVRRPQDADRLCAEGSERLRPLLMDVTDAASIERAKEVVNRAEGEAGLWGLVNNAGMGFCSPLEFTPMEQIRGLFEVNVFGLMAVTQAFLPALRQARGRIVNISSTASLLSAPFHGVYAAAKRSVNAFSTVLRMELRPYGVQVSNMLCGAIQTPIWDKAGRQTDRIMQGLPPQASQLYGDNLGTLHQYFEKISGAGIPAEEAARIIAHALTARKAKNTYFIGPDARMNNFLDKILYGRLRDWVMLRTIGIRD
jgi:NAD(P)-dependent dehydrogenase (short-subunit alcohol dehydrogenase family)